MLAYQDDNSIKANHFRYVIFPECTMPSHFHTCFEMIYAMKGDTVFQLDDESMCLKEGEMSLFMPNQIHSFTVPTDALLWVCVFSGNLVETFCSETENRRYLHPVFRPSQALVDFLPEEPDVKFESPYLLQAFLYRLCHEFYQQELPFVTVPNMDSDSIHKIMSYITLHYNEDISLDTLAKTFGLNRNYISGLISRTTRQNFRAYLNGYRLEKAKELLRNTDLSVTEIAYECGFNNIRTFNRTFMGSEKVTPMEYRRSR